MTRLIIDTDPGVDDAHAILMAFAHSDTQIEAITTVAGNVSLKRTTANACTILDVVGREDVPVYAGCDGAILRAPHDASYVHGSDGLGDSNYPPSARRPIDEHAVLALIRMANEAPGERTLVAIGPLTNVALATRLDPALPTKYKRLVWMGGAVWAGGNIGSHPSAEFNAWSDPEAAAIVLEAWPGMSLLSWDVTLEHPITAEQIDLLMKADTPRGEFFRRITGSLMNYQQAKAARTVMYEPDALAVAVAIEPDIVRRAEMHYVQVELAGAHTRGQTTVDWRGLSGKGPNVNIILELDRDRFWEMFRAGVM
jgi:purine nucleosidase